MKVLSLYNMVKHPIKKHCHNSAFLLVIQVSFIKVYLIFEAVYNKNNIN